MTTLDPADLVMIAGRTLGLSTDAALAQMDLGAAQDALAAAAEAQPPGAELSDRAGAASAGVRLVTALLRHRPFPAHGQQVAVAAGLQYLSLNGWRADLNPPATAAVVVEALASGRLTPDDAAAWLSPRLTPERRARRAPRLAPGSGPRRLISRRAVRVPAGRAVAAAALAVTVTGVTLLSAACSRGPALPAAPSGSTSSTGPAPARPADLAYAACMHSRGVESFPDLSASGVAVIIPAAGIDLNSPRFRSAEATCKLAVPAASVRVAVADTAHSR